MADSPVRDAILKLRQSIPEGVRFLLVTKTVGEDRVREAFEAGVSDFGENRVQELLAKKKKLPPGIRWHMIGRLQTNKVKRILGEVVLIHSLDRPELAREIEKQAGVKKIKQVDCLIQVNSSGETSKSGFAPAEVEGFAASLAPDSPVRIRGLMAVGPLTEDCEKIRRAFRAVKNLRETLKQKFPERDWGILSMGMSGDYRIAVEEGANWLRIGSAVFGKRL